MHTGTMVDDTRMLIYGGRGPDGKVSQPSFVSQGVLPYAAVLNNLLIWAQALQVASAMKHAACLQCLDKA